MRHAVATGSHPPLRALPERSQVQRHGKRHPVAGLGAANRVLLRVPTRQAQAPTHGRRARRVTRYEGPRHMRLPPDRA